MRLKRKPKRLTVKPMSHFPLEAALKEVEAAFISEGQITSATWDSASESDKRFARAQASLISYVRIRAYTALAQEAYKLTRGESTRRWINIFSYHYPRTSDDIKAGKVPQQTLQNMWWSNFPTVSLINGPKAEGTAIFERLSLPNTVEAVRQAIEYEGGPFRLFVFNSGKRSGNVFQVRWDGCVGSAYINHCRARGEEPDVREGETVLSRGSDENPPFQPMGKNVGGYFVNHDER